MRRALPTLPAPVTIESSQRETIRLVLSGEKAPKYLVKDDIEAVIACVKKPRDRLLLNLMWKTGLRISEALALTPNSFQTVKKGEVTQVYLVAQTLKQRRVKVRGQPGRPKETSVVVQRTLPVAPSLLSDIFAFINETKNGMGGVTRDTCIFCIGRSHAWRLVRQAFEDAWPTVRARGTTAAGNKRDWMAYAHPHVFRHSFAIHCVLNNVPRRIIQGWLGHRTSKATEVYDQVLGVDTREIMDKVVF